MDIFSVFGLLGGLALFLFGMSVMSSGLEKLAGGRLENIIKGMTSNKYKSLALGAGVTAVIQSSSAVTVMLVGLVNSGIMSLEQSVGAIMGSNIGTTITAWILSLVGISSDNIVLKMLKPTSFSPLLAFIGILLYIASKSSRKKDAGLVLIGFAILMYGMNFMSESMKPLANNPGFTSMLTAFNNPILGVLAGACDYCCNSELLSIGRNSSSDFTHRWNYLRNSNSNHNGIKYRNLRDIFNIKYRRKQKFKESCNNTYYVQCNLNSNFYSSILCSTLSIQICLHWPKCSSRKYCYSAFAIQYLPQRYYFRLVKAW